MTTHRIVFHFGLLATMLVAFVGCSDYEDNYIDIPSEDVFTLIRDSVQVDFRLINEHGDTTTTFREGEDIVFDLCITSYANQRLPFGDDRDLLGDDMFRIFSSKGKDLGVAGIYTEYNRLMYGSLIKEYPLRWQYSLQGRFSPQYPFNKEYRRDALPIGDYYVIAPVHLLNLDVFTCQIHFTIY